MKIFDLMNLEEESFEKRRMNVFFQNDMFSTRLITLQPGEKIPDCRMECFVLFYVVKGEILLRKNDESTTLKENCVFITEPALLSMETDTGARLMGVQIKTAS